MRTVSTRDALDAALAPSRAAGRRVALVPTMGALHEGHAALLHAARGSADLVVVSIFVNPLQFGPTEDLSTYPRTLDDDLRVCADAGVNVVFTPALDIVYPDGDPEITVDPGPLGRELEGASRPGHFRGVLTVVTKLLGLARAQVALFGEKDYQQLVLIRRCVRDLCLDVEIVGVETVRAVDGLALSSRNRYLDDEGRTTARGLSRSLRAGAEHGGEGPEAVLSAAATVLAEVPGLNLDYLELRDPDLRPLTAAGDARLLVAARVGAVRLIDNIAVELACAPGSPAMPAEPIRRGF